MSPQLRSRREVLKMGVGAASVAAVAGCAGALSGDDAGASFDAVPADATFVATVDAERVLDDETLRNRVADSMEGGNPLTGSTVSVQGMLDGIESELGLDPRDIRELVAFGRESSLGLLVDAGWNEDAVTTAIEDQRGELASTTHAGQPVYEAADTAVGVLPDGRYAVGVPAVVRETIDVAAGDADAVSGDLRTAFEDAPEGYLRFAFELPAGMAPDEQAGVASLPLEGVEYGYGALSRDGDTRGGELTVETASSDTASAIVSALEAGLATARKQVAENDRLAETFDGDATAVLDATSVAQDGSTVTLENDDGRGLLATVPPAVLATFLLDLGSSSGSAPPTASFQFDYDEAAGTLTITHEAGDAIPASALSVRGEGIAATGPWTALGGSTHTQDGEELVVAGDRIQLDAESNFDVRLIWESSSGSAVLVRGAGPDA
jgi:hypothetical protein